LSQEEYALEVFDVDVGFIIDRTKTRHKYPFDVDVRKPSAPKGRNIWIYWGSHHTIEKAKNMINRHLKKSLGADAEDESLKPKAVKFWRLSVETERENCLGNIPQVSAT